jgi:hypothetical protein
MDADLTGQKTSVVPDKKMASEPADFGLTYPRFFLILDVNTRNPETQSSQMSCD